MQAWQQVKVINAASGFIGQAGYIIRVEAHADKTLVAVKLDADGSVQNFDSTELAVLG